MGPPSYMRSVVDRNVVMRLMTVQERKSGNYPSASYPEKRLSHSFVSHCADGRSQKQTGLYLVFLALCVTSRPRNHFQFMTTAWPARGNSEALRGLWRIQTDRQTDKTNFSTIALPAAISARYPSRTKCGQTDIRHKTGVTDTAVRGR